MKYIVEKLHLMPSMRSVSLGVSVIVFCTASGLSNAAVVVDSLPYKNTPDWTDIVFSGTSMNLAPSGDSVTLTTSYGAGVWFGWGAGYGNQPASWAPGNNAAGNYLRFEASFSNGSADWSTYFYDRSYNAFFDFAPTGCSGNQGSCYGLNGAAGVGVSHAGSTSTEYASTFIPLDLSLSHTYEFLLKDGQVSYRIDGLNVYSGAAWQVGFANPLLVIGDGSGSSLTGRGSMTIYNIRMDNAPAERILASSVPIPASFLLFGSGLLAIFGSLASRKNQLRIR